MLLHLSDGHTATVLVMRCVVDRSEIATPLKADSFCQCSDLSPVVFTVLIPIRIAIPDDLAACRIDDCNVES